MTHTQHKEFISGLRGRSDLGAPPGRTHTLENNTPATKGMTRTTTDNIHEPST